MGDAFAGTCNHGYIRPRKCPHCEVKADQYADHKQCERHHIKKLKTDLKKMGFQIWSEHGEDPDGWVNVSCRKCLLTHEVALVRR